MELFDFDSALDRFMGEREILIEVLPPYLESLHNNLKELSSLNPKTDCKKIRELAHSIKGSSLNLDLVPLGEEAEKLEDMAYNNKIEKIPEVIENIKDLATRSESELKKYL